jgi:hypothetical protein
LQDWDAPKFTSEVFDTIVDLTELGFGQPQDASGSGFSESLSMSESPKLRWFSNRKPKEIEEEINQAIIVVENSEIFDSLKVPGKAKLTDTLRSILCPTLKCLSNDVFEIAKVSIPILLSLSLAGTIALPAEPLVFGVVAFIIAKSGVITACNDHKD